MWDFDKMVMILGDSLKGGEYLDQKLNVNFLRKFLLHEVSLFRINVQTVKKNQCLRRTKTKQTP
jgi:hypothetical protein